MTRCLNCMQAYEEQSEICPYCGYRADSATKEVYHLKPGTVLNKKYVIGTVIGFGGFGVVYRAWDDNLKRVVAVKEYYPTIYLNRSPETNEVSVYDKKNVNYFISGKAEFLQEARNVAKFNTHPNIVHVYDFFEENGTAYFVMEYLEGYTLKDYIKEATSKGQVIETEAALYITKALLNALKAAHKDNIIHRDIKPGNIYILPDGTVKLFDFGAARFADMETEKTRTVIITPGYAPPEQYQVKSRQGAYTDIYAVGAMLYEMLTGIRPEESVNRKVEDTVQNPNVYNRAIPKNINNAIMRAMAVQSEIRFKTVEEFEAALVSPRQIRDAKAEMRHRRRIRNFRIFCLTAILGVCVYFCGRMYFDEYREAVLAEACIEIWAPSVNGDIDETRAMYEAMLEEFRAGNGQIDVRLEIIDAEMYPEVLEQALAADAGPELFDSSLLGQDMSRYLADVSGVMDLENFDRTQFYYLQSYATYFPQGKQMPLSCEVPVIYGNSMYPDLKNSEDYEAYLSDASNYLGTTADYDRVQADMAGIYKIVQTVDTERQGEFRNLWSVNAAASQEEAAAAIRILYYFLSDISQEILTIENAQGLPLNKNVWDVFVEISSDFNYLTDVMEEISMKKR